MQEHKTPKNPLLSDDPTLLIEQSLGDIVELLQQNDLLCAGNYQDLPEELAEKGHFVPCYDSRLLGERHLFVAIAGEYFDGHKFISAALEKGSKAVICEVLPEQKLLEQLQQQGILVLQVKQSRQALSLLSAACFGTLNTLGTFRAKQEAKQKPEQEPKQTQLQVLGVTGTDGKSSIAYLLYQILRRRHTVGLLSTFGLDLGNGLEANPVHQTTPESLLVHCALAQMRAQGCRYAVLECSSHGLSQKTARLQHVEFAAAIFSNLSPEHLEFHGSMEAYARDKAALFARLCPRGFAVWNMDESSSEALYAAAQMPEGICHIGYGTQLAELGPKQEQGQEQEQKLDLPRKQIPFSQKFLAHKLKLQIDGSEFEIQKNRTQENKTKAASVDTEQENSHCKIAIPGSVYVSNTLAALALSCALEAETLQNILDSLKESKANVGGAQLCLRAPKGRMQLLSSSAPFSVLVDYAHSPGAFARLLPEMRALLDSSESPSKDSRKDLSKDSGKPNKSRLLLLFGSGGQRDRAKRPLQGQIAAEHADVIVLCNEDPRNEDPMAILQEIRAGVLAHSDLASDAFAFCEGKNLFLLPDRKAAIHKILAQAQAGDLVLLLGKGHETSIIVEGLQELPWDEFEVAKKALEAMAYRTYYS